MPQACLVEQIIDKYGRLISVATNKRAGIERGLTLRPRTYSLDELMTSPQLTARLESVLSACYCYNTDNSLGSYAMHHFGIDSAKELVDRRKRKSVKYTAESHKLVSPI